MNWNIDYNGETWDFAGVVTVVIIAVIIAFVAWGLWWPR